MLLGFIISVSSAKWSFTDNDKLVHLASSGRAGFVENNFNQSYFSGPQLVMFNNYCTCLIPSSRSTSSSRKLFSNIERKNRFSSKKRLSDIFDIRRMLPYSENLCIFDLRTEKSKNISHILDFQLWWKKSFLFNMLEEIPVLCIRI